MNVTAVIRQLGLFLKDLALRAWDIVSVGVLRLLGFIERWLVEKKHAQYGVAVMRMVLGVAGFGLLWANFSARSYLYGPASFWTGEQLGRQSDLPNVWILGLGDLLAGNLTAFTTLYLVTASLALAVILGWRIRITLPLFFILYVGIVELNSATGDQGDNAFRICLFWLLFAGSADRLSLDARRRANPPSAAAKNLWSRILRGEQRIVPDWLQNAAHNLVLVLLTAQVTFIYVSGGLYKAGGDPWSGGTAVYAPLHVQAYSTWPELADLITTWGPMVALGSWGSIVLQISFPFMLLHRFTRIIALVGILGFHAAIGLLMGLPFFSLSMIAIDAIFVRDRSWLGVGGAIRDAWQKAREALPSPVRAPALAVAGAPAEALPANEPAPVAASASAPAPSRRVAPAARKTVPAVAAMADADGVPPIFKPAATTPDVRPSAPVPVPATGALPITAPVPVAAVSPEPAAPPATMPVLAPVPLRATAPESEPPKPKRPSLRDRAAGWIAQRTSARTTSETAPGDGKTPEQDLIAELGFSPDATDAADAPAPADVSAAVTAPVTRRSAATRTSDAAPAAAGEPDSAPAAARKPVRAPAPRPQRARPAPIPAPLPKPQTGAPAIKPPTPKPQQQAPAAPPRPVQKPVAPVTATVRTVRPGELPAWAQGIKPTAPASPAGADGVQKPAAAKPAAAKPAWLADATARVKAERDS